MQEQVLTMLAEAGEEGRRYLSGGYIAKELGTRPLYGSTSKPFGQMVASYGQHPGWAITSLTLTIFSRPVLCRSLPP